MSAPVLTPGPVAGAAPSGRAGRRGLPASGAGLLALVVGLLSLVPLAVVVQALATTPWATTRALVLRPRTLELLTNTAALVGGAVTLSLVLGVGAAWLVTRTDLPASRFWHAALVAPLAVPAFVSAYAWSSVLPTADGYDGALLVTTLAYAPLVYVPVAAALRGLDPAQAEVASALGLSPAAAFRRVTLPQLRPALLGGALLVALHLVAEFGALALLRFPTLSTAVYDQFRSSFSGPASTSMAAVLVVVSLVLLGGELGLQGRGRYAAVGRGATRPVAPVRLGARRVPALLALTALVAASVLVPLVVIGRWWLDGSSSSVDPGLLLGTAASSLGLGLVAALVVVLAAVPVAWLAVRRPGPLSVLVERLTFLGTGLPGIVVALSLVTVGLRVVPGLYQSPVMLVAAYGVLFLPRAVVSLTAGLKQLPPVVEEAAATLGLRPLSVLRRVVLPALAPAAGAGAALVFLGASTELTATLLLSPLGTRTLATEFWSHSSAVEYGAAAPYAALLVLLCAPAAWLVARGGNDATRRLP
ncbi:ABC transporter permease [Lapillicoccus jejuensis]|uniref:Iron(III) transport system permease protein n=1 Tax=Lapillicoccus jejuensis TaxID=402171 RepID=A0A542E1U1_9MICO|nr:iron ABC transporter permease [Lapillicoccus jejuensis]TQJ09311.1 iron(III) transport system permease protein [Lapillicoccus jejuensis]